MGAGQVAPGTPSCPFRLRYAIRTRDIGTSTLERTQPPSPPSRDALRVLLADDHQLILTGLRTALERAPGIEVVGEASSGRAALNAAMRSRPDVVLLDLRMPDGDGLWALRELRRVLPDTKVIVLSMFDDHQHVHQALADGATGYIIKTIDPDDLASAIRQTVAGTVVSARAVIDPRRASTSRRPTAASPSASSRSCSTSPRGSRTPRSRSGSG